MNHLAHALLAGPDPDCRLGGMLGDFVRGAIDPTLGRGVGHGIALHRAIDSYTDTHDAIVEARALFEPPYRRYAGILIDIWFDHLLARDFDRWSEVPLASFSDELQALLRERWPELPPALQRFSRYLGAHRLPAAYAEREMIGEVLAGVGSRLTRSNPLARGLVEISRLETELDCIFARFFPQLLAFAESWREARGLP